jgi:hypothetical protein
MHEPSGRVTGRSPCQAMVCLIACTDFVCVADCQNPSTFPREASSWWIRDALQVRRGGVPRRLGGAHSTA